MSIPPALLRQFSVGWLIYFRMFSQHFDTTTGHHVDALRRETEMFNERRDRDPSEQRTEDPQRRNLRTPVCLLPAYLILGGFTWLKLGLEAARHGFVINLSTSDSNNPQGYLRLKFVRDCAGDDLTGELRQLAIESQHFPLETHSRLCGMNGIPQCR